MSNTTEPKRPRGRPKGQPKPPKPPAKMGRPSVWDASLSPTRSHNVCAPGEFFELIKNPDFKRALSNLLLDFTEVK